jgi:3-(3-hydroxy-phenyl)propionate hydroxylase
VLLTRQDMALTCAAEAILRVLSCRRFRVGVDVQDSEGHLAHWFDTRGAEAVWVRPDFYVAAMGVDATRVSASIERLGAAMMLSIESNAHQ